MEFSRALLIIGSRPAQHQRWMGRCLPRQRIFTKRQNVSLLLNPQWYTSFQSPTGSSTAHCEQFSRQNLVFLYQRINWAASEIRLIELLPRKDSEDNAEDTPLACSMRHFSLDDCPKYLALSYAWGDIERTESLILNGEVLKITKSLDTALRQLCRMIRQGDLPGKTQIWVDAISINQNDDLEKSWQVRQMGRIYRDAEYALVWLGSESDSSAAAMKELDHFGKAIEAGDIDFEGATVNLVRLLTDINISIGSSLTALFRRSWWVRVWVVQEFSFAKDVLFICGDTTIWCRPFFKALDMLQQFMSSIAIQGWRGNLHGGDYRRFMAELSSIRNILRLFHIREKLNLEDMRFSMWELLALKRSGIQATDNRDMVYALIGLSADAASKQLHPDYSRGVKQVYIQTAMSFLAERRLRLLWFCSQPRVLNNLPSWVPDWSGPWRNDYRYLSEDGGHGESGQIFSATRESQPVISFSVKGTHTLLHIDGYEFDTIDDTGSDFDMSRTLHTGGFYRVHLAIADRGRALWELKQKHPSAEGASYDEIIRTTITDMELYWNSDGAFKHRRADNDLVKKLYHSFVVPTEEQVLETSRNLPASQLHILIRNDGRRPFITSRGHLGLGPSAMLPGDKIAVLFGAELPFILRQDDGGYYQIIGEAYVHGIMDGEIMAMGFKAKSFDIQ